MKPQHVPKFNFNKTYSSIQPSQTQKVVKVTEIVRKEQSIFDSDYTNQQHIGKIRVVHTNASTLNKPVTKLTDMQQ